MLKFIASAVAGMLLLKAGGTIESYRATAAKLDSHIRRLDGEEWFKSIRDDYRYDHMLNHNSRLRKYLANEKNVNLLLVDAAEQQKFSALMNEEFEKLIKRK